MKTLNWEDACFERQDCRARTRGKFIRSFTNITKIDNTSKIRKKQLKVCSLLLNSMRGYTKQVWVVECNIVTSILHKAVLSVCTFARVCLCTLTPPKLPNVQT